MKLCSSYCQGSAPLVQCNDHWTLDSGLLAPSTLSRAQDCISGGQVEMLDAPFSHEIEGTAAGLFILCPRCTGLFIGSASIALGSPSLINSRLS